MILLHLLLKFFYLLDFSLNFNLQHLGSNNYQINMIFKIYKDANVR